MAKLSQLIYHPVVLIGLTLASLLFFLSLLKTTQQTQYSAQNIKKMQEKVAQTEAEVEDIQLSLDKARQPLSQEKIIRNELLMQKPGEYVVQISDESLKHDSKQKTETKTQGKTPWESWQELLFKI